MNIAIVCFSSIGGSGAVGTDLGKELAKLGHKVHFIAPEVPFRLIGPWRKNIYFHTVETVTEHPLFEKYPLYPYQLANKIVEVIKREKIDIVHAHYIIPHALSGYLAIEAVKKEFPHIKLVTTIHGTDVSLLSADPTIRDMAKLALEKSDGITAVAEKLAQDALSKYAISKPIKTIYNFIYPKDYPAKQAKEIRDVFANSNQQLIIHISNFREVKRIHDVIEIFKKIVKKVDVKLLMVGDGPDLRRAHSLASKFKLLNKIHFLGLQSNVDRLLAISDLFLLPSELEAFSLAALEAMSHAVPVITTNIGGMPEMINSGEDGYIAEVGDIETMSKIAVDLLTDSNKKKKIGSAAQMKVRKKFIPDVIVAEYEKYYNKVLKQK